MMPLSLLYPDVDARDRVRREVMPTEFPNTGMHLRQHGQTVPGASVTIPAASGTRPRSVPGESAGSPPAPGRNGKHGGKGAPRNPKAHPRVLPEVT